MFCLQLSPDTDLRLSLSLLLVTPKENAEVQIALSKAGAKVHDSSEQPCHLLMKYKFLIWKRVSPFLSYVT